MANSQIPQKILDSVGRTFNLVFNQIFMYNVNHPVVERAVGEFHKALAAYLKKQSPLHFIINRGRFFIDEKPIEDRINATKMADHFKRGKIESVSFEQGISLDQLKTFIEIFADLQKHPHVEAMKDALARKGLTKFKINYVYYKKMTEDEDVVSVQDKDVLEKISTGTVVLEDPDEVLRLANRTVALDDTDDASEQRPFSAAPAGKNSGGGGFKSNVVLEEYEQTLTIDNFLNDPAKISGAMIDSDLYTVLQDQQMKTPPGKVLVHQLKNFKEKVNQAIANTQKGHIEKYAEKAFALKRTLGQKMDEQRDKGIVYAGETEIRSEAEEIADNVLIRLIKEEYNKGSVSVKRMAQIILRLVPETGELQRILPKIKKALMEEGMSLADFLQLVREMKNELQSDELARVLENSASSIGLAGEDLIREIVKNPKDAAELIVLAAEIRKSAGDKTVLSDMLVEYIEQAGSEMALDSVKGIKGDNFNNLQDNFARIQHELLGNLKQSNIDTDVIDNVEAKLLERMEDDIRKLRESIILKYMTATNAGNIQKETLLKIVRESAQEEEELDQFMQDIKQRLLDQGVAVPKFEEIYDELLGTKATKEKPKSPKGTLNRQSTLYMLDNEISRCNRYETYFSALSFAIIKASAPKDVNMGKKGKVTFEDILEVVIGEIAELVRDTDLVGMMTKKIIMVLLPMTDAQGAKLLLGRIRTLFNTRTFLIKEGVYEIKIAGVSTTFEQERTGNINDFTRIMQTELTNLVSRLSHIQSLM